MSLKTAFIVVAVIEAFYGAAGLLIPPSLIEPVLGWQLSPDGQWVTKLLGLSLATQSVLALQLRHHATRALAFTLAAYQIGATVIDVVLWTTLADQGIFSNPLASWSIVLAIPTHLAIGAFLLIAALRHRES